MRAITFLIENHLEHVVYMQLLIKKNTLDLLLQLLSCYENLCFEMTEKAFDNVLPS